MARKGPGLGEDLANRLMARGGEGVQRRGMADGGEVFTGQVVDRAMKAMGGRMKGFTMDRTISVPTSFDASRAEDKALYAHERWHQAHSGGDDDGGGRHGDNPDGEEAEARAIEEMVMHRAGAGEDLGAIMADIQSHGPTGGGDEGGGQKNASAATVSKAVIGGDKDRDPMDGYRAMREKMGYSHKQVVDELRQFVMDAMNRLGEEHAWRTSEKDFF